MRIEPAEVESKLKSSGYDVSGYRMGGILHVAVRLQKPHMWLKVVRITPTGEVESYVDENTHARALTTRLAVAKLFGVEGEIEDGGSPF
jgi:hypothetical protein